MNNVLNQEDIIRKLEDNIISSITNSINGLSDEILNLKNIVIKRSQEENEKLHDKYKKLGKRVIFLEKDINFLSQHGWRNNIVFTVMPDILQDDELEEGVKSILSDIDVNLDMDDVEDWHRVGKSDSKTKSKKEPL